MMSQQSLPSRALRVMLELSPTAQIFHVVTSGYDGTARVWPRPSPALDPWDYPAVVRSSG